MWSQPLARRILQGQVEDIVWYLDTYLDSKNQIEFANLNLWIDDIPHVLPNVLNQKHSSLYEQLTKLMIDPALRDMIITDIHTNMNRQGIIPGPILR